jgi:hypothetical protein
LVSPQQDYVALLSYSSTDNPGTRANAVGGGEPSIGELFVDTYTVSSGRKILSGHTSYRGFGPTVVFDTAAWAENVFVFPVDTLLQTCFLLEVGSR